MIDAETIRCRFELLSPYLDEKTRRLIVAAEAQAIGFGGISIVARTTGLASGSLVEDVKGQLSPTQL